MTKNLKTSRSGRTQSKQVVKTGRDSSQGQTVSRSKRASVVTPTSERIIMKTSVKRRKAMKVLANRQPGNLTSFRREGGETAL